MAAAAGEVYDEPAADAGGAQTREKTGRGFIGKATEGRMVNV